MHINWFEVFGIAASLVVALSLMMKNIKRLRIYNAVGALAFSIYGIMIGSLSVAVLNGFIVLIDIYFLWKLWSTRDRFDLLERDVFDSPYVELFMKFYKADIERYQPGFAPKPGEGWKADLVLREMNPVSLVIFRQLDENTVEIGLDYAVPSHRDYKNAEYYFGKISERMSLGKKIRFVQKSSVAEHTRYLERLGFTSESGSEAPDGSRIYKKELS